MSLTAEQVSALREVEEVWPGIDAVIIGAAALGFYYDMRWRRTADVDLMLALELDEFPGALVRRPGWRRHPIREHEFTSPTGARLDLLPAGRDLIAGGQITWSSGNVMSLEGMDLAFEHAERQNAVDGYEARVAPPHVVAMLKMVAYCDRPAERERDLEDIGHLLESYVDETCERRWDEACDQEFVLAPAYLLGLDVGRVVTTDGHRELVKRFFGRVGDPESPSHAQMRRKGPRGWRTDEDALRLRLEAFRAGMSAAANDHRPPRDVHRQLEDLERKAARYLWPLADLARQIDSLTPDAGERARLCRLLGKLHDAALDSGLRCIPAPAVTRDPDAGVEFEWFYKKSQRVLAFALSDKDGEVWMYWARGGAGHEEVDPTNATIVDALCSVGSRSSS
jgi:predicted nucleotidyltransferase